MNLTSFTYSIAPKHPPVEQAVPGVAAVVGECTGPLDIRAKILRLQHDMLTTMPVENRIDCPLKHHFAPGVYAREIFIPAGTVIIGKIHKHAHVNIISQGSASVMTEFGEMKIEAPCTFISQPGTKRAVLAITDVIWTTVHPTDETDLAKIEDEVIAKDYAAMGVENRPAADMQVIGD